MVDGGLTSDKDQIGWIDDDVVCPKCNSSNVVYLDDDDYACDDCGACWEEDDEAFSEYVEEGLPDEF